MEFAKEKVRLEHQLAEEIRIGRLKKKQMKNRYDQIRTELTELWEGAKRAARKERIALQKRYEGQLNTMRDTMAKLENDLKTAITERDELKAMLELKDKAIQKANLEEIRQKKMAMERTKEIMNLKSKMIDLEKELEDKELGISTLQTELQQKETEISRKGFRNRVKRVFSRVKNSFRRTES